MKIACKNVWCLLCTILCLFISENIFSSPYWQQEVHYTIHVSLDDVNNFLNADLSMRYVNHSPDELNIIWFHLWPNGYSNTSTPFAKQQLENKSTEFYFSEESEKGYIDSLHFEVNGETVMTDFDPATPDIIKLILNEPLKSGQGILITTPFRVKIPGSFSRMGHVGQAYQITQWYPKPAVYDAQGWHPIPYLDQGEFYSEFGSFDVFITVPKNYVVGATGNLQNADELQWLKHIADSTRNIESFGTDVSFPTSSTTFKTLHYSQANIHDFGWFADKRYHVLCGEVELPKSHRKVTTWVMFTNKRAQIWKDAIPYVNHAVYNYSQWLGDYPYDNCTALQGALLAGGGMEYPTITVISADGSAKGLDIVIAHEVGHNWLYGILGFNEREHPWMDEGINSYYENRYDETEYPNDKLMGGLAGFTKGFQLDKYPHQYQYYLTYMISASQNNDQALDQNAANFTSLNYGAMVYMKTQTAFQYLENYLGKAEMDSVMHRFYSEWKFKHPMPDDLKTTFENETGKELDWMFNDLIETTNKLDYKILGLDDTMHIGHDVFDLVHVKNTADIKGPFVISAIKNDSVVNSIWYNGFYGNMDVLFPKGNYNTYRIDPNYTMPEMNRNNNTIRTKGLFKKCEPLRLQWLGSLQNPERTQLFFTPVLTWNEYDHFMPGMALYNSLFPQKHFEFFLMPVYSFSTKQINGNAKFSYHIFPVSNWLHKISLTASAMQFACDYNPNMFIPVYTTYLRLHQAVNFELKKKTPRSKGSSMVNFRNDMFRIPITTYGMFGNPELPNHWTFKRNYQTISFIHINTNSLTPFSYNINLQHGHDGFENNFSKIYGELKIRATYFKPKTGMDIRLFGGSFLGGDRNPYINEFFHMNAGTGSQDYLFDEIYFGRSEFQGLLSQQVNLNDGAMKVRTDYTMGMGETDTWLLAANLRSSLPFHSPFFLFADAGTYGGSSADVYGKFMFTGGVGISLFAHTIEIYSPLVFSNNIRTNQLTYPEYDQWFEHLMFTFNIKRLNPFELLNNLNL